MRWSWDSYDMTLSLRLRHIYWERRDLILRHGRAARGGGVRVWNPRTRLYPVSQPLGPSGGPSQNLPPSGPWYELLLVLFPVFAPLRRLEKKKTEGWCFMSYSWARGSNNASLMKYQLGKISKSPVGASLQMVRDWIRLLRVVIICFLFVTCPAVPELESYFFPVRGPAPRDFCHCRPDEDYRERFEETKFSKKIGSSQYHGYGERIELLAYIFR